MPKLTKEEFQDGLLNNIDELYLAYAKTEASQDAIDEVIDLAASAGDNLPEFNAPDPVMTEEQLNEKIDVLAKAIKAEQVALKFGSVAISIILKTSGLPL